MPAALERMVYHVPVIGWLARDAVQGAPDAKYWFIANMVMLLGAGIYLYGYPVLIIYALGATALAFLGLIVLTGADLVEQARRKRAEPESAASSQLSMHERNKD